MARTAQPNRPLRVDAQRNRDRILEISEQYFAERGVSVPLEDIARSAGVGIGTLYRHFPTREALLASLLEAREERLAQHLAALRSDCVDAVAALQGWLCVLAEWASAFDGLPGPLREAIAEKTSPLTLTCEGYIDTTDTFLTAAQRQGSARPEVRARDLFLMVLAASWVRGAAMADDTSADAMIELLRTGWAAPGTGAEPG